MDDHRREALLKEYGEVSSNFRTLTDVRFRLLTLLPIAAAAGALLKGETLAAGSFAFNLFGFAATIGLITYNARNDQLYDELVGRAAAIERSLGLPEGTFANRPRPWLTIHVPAVDRKWKVDHRTGVAGHLRRFGRALAIWIAGASAGIRAWHVLCVRLPARRDCCQLQLGIYCCACPRYSNPHSPDYS
jgi:hypothetical protein